MSDDFRSMVEGAYVQAEAGAEAVAGGTSDVADAPDAGAGAEGSGVLAGQDGAADGDGSQSGDGRPPPTDRPRDAAGKFAPKDKAAPKVAPRQKVEQLATQPRPGEGADPAKPITGEASPHLAGDGSLPVETLKPPAGLTPSEREHFAKAPPEIQKALARMDATARQAAQESVPAKRFQQEVHQAFSPYSAFAQSLGATPLQLAHQATQTAHALATAPLNRRAEIVATLIQNHGVPLEMINAQLEGRAVPQEQGQGQGFDKESVIREAEERMLQRLQGQRNQSVASEAQREVAAFESDPAHEYATDPQIRRRMQIAMSVAAQNQQELSIKDAYQEALWASPDHRAILQRRATADAEKARMASNQQAIRAASSVRSAPSTGNVSVKAVKTPRDAVMTAWETLDSQQ